MLEFHMKSRPAGTIHALPFPLSALLVLAAGNSSRLMERILKGFEECKGKRLWIQQSQSSALVPKTHRINGFFGGFFPPFPAEWSDWKAGGSFHISLKSQSTWIFPALILQRWEGPSQNPSGRGLGSLVLRIPPEYPKLEGTKPIPRDQFPF